MLEQMPAQTILAHPLAPGIATPAIRLLHSGALPYCDDHDHISS